MTDFSRSHVIPWLCLAIPALYLVAAALVAALHRAPASRSYGLAASLSLAAAAAAAVIAVGSPFGPSLADPLTALFGSTLDEARVFSLRPDTLSGAMLLLVTFIGWVVVRFSRRYLDGDPRQLVYLRRLLLTLAAVSALVLSNNLALIALLWLATSLCLHGLLTHFDDRDAAQIAAHKKFLLSRLADTALLGAICLTAGAAGSVELDRVFAFATQSQELPPALAMASALIAISVLLKCAQVPFHGWLIQVMEAPTPVSALLHAGVVNIGGFLLIRLAPLMSQAHVAQGILLVVGMATAVAASLVMLTRISVKVSLAWSTCAQMGLMVVECALGAYDMALLHLLAHSLYKAHAFLSAGGAVATQRVAAMAPHTAGPGFGALMAAGGASAACVTASLTLAGVDVIGSPARWFPVSLLALALPSLLLKVPERRSARRVARLAATAAGIVVGFAAGHAAFQALLPHAPSSPEPPVAAAAFATFGLAVLFVAHAWVRERPHSRLASWLYPRAFAGFHLDEVFTRLTFRLWPAKLPSSRTSSVLVAQPCESSSP